MSLCSVDPNGNRERLTRSSLARAILFKTQYTPVGLNIEVSVVDGPVLKPLAAVLAPYQRLVHPEAL